MINCQLLTAIAGDGPVGGGGGRSGDDALAVGRRVGRQRRRNVVSEDETRSCTIREYTEYNSTTDELHIQIVFTYSLHQFGISNYPPYTLLTHFSTILGFNVIYGYNIRSVSCEIKKHRRTSQPVLEI